MTRHPIRTSAGHLAVVLCLVLVGQALLSQPAQAVQTVTVDFETGPAADVTPITTQYLASSFVQFIRADLGYRPYRRLVGASRARSGSYVVDVGSDVCPMEVDNTQDCEFTGSGTQGRLSRGATTVTLYAGLFRSSSGGAVSARLVGLRADGSVAATGSAVVLNAVHFNVPVTVTSAAGDIAAFRLSAEGPGAIGSAVGFDDLTFEFPDTSSPDITLTMGSGTLEILQGRTLDVPITTLRIDGSDGPLALSVSGLPTFVTAQILPNPLPGTEQGAVLRLTASIAAPPTTAQLTVTADPQGNSAVAPGPRTVTRSLRVSSNFEIEAGTTGEMFLPPCAPVEYPLRVTRAETFKDVITLTADNVPAGVTATFLPDDTLGPEGPFLYLPRLVLSRQAGGSAANGFVRVGATSGSISRYLYVPIEPQSPQASVAGNAIGWGPMKEHKGWEVTLEGNGFCPGTAIEMTDSVPAEQADVTVAPDGRSMTFRVDRLAEDGPVTVVPPTGAGFSAYDTTNRLDVRTFRNHLAFQFDNFKWGALSWGEFEELVGPDDAYLSINPCFPFGSCTMTSNVADPRAVSAWVMMKGLVRVSGAHCYGISRTIQELLRGRVPYDRFEDGVTRPFDLGWSGGPTPELRHYLDNRHAGQLTLEFIEAFVARKQDLAHQVQRVRDELAAGRFPAISILRAIDPSHPLRAKGHVVLAYDIKTTSDGFDIYVYDNRSPYLPGPTTKLEPDHEEFETGAKGVIEINGGLWAFNAGGSKNWSGGGHKFWMIPYGALPDNPSIPSLHTLQTVPFSLGQLSSEDGAARIAEASAGSEWLPVLDDAAPAGAVGTLIGPQDKPLTMTVEGTRTGTYATSLTGPGFAASIPRMATDDGVTDRVDLAPQGNRVTFHSGSATRPLELTLSDEAGDTQHLAVLRTTTSAGGSDRAGLDAGGLSLLHRGSAARLSVELTSFSPRGLVRATVPALRVGPGDRVKVKPTWSSLARARIVVTSPGGHRRVHTIDLNVARLDVGLRLRRPQLVKKAGHDVLVQKIRLTHPPADTVGGLVMVLRRAGKDVARRSVGLRNLRRGLRTVRWSLPAELPAGTYRVTTRLTALVGGDAPATRTSRRSWSVQIP